MQYKTYYQWVPFVLFLHALMFYTPHTIFKMWEGEKVQTLIDGLDQIVLNKGIALPFFVKFVILSCFLCSLLPLILFIVTYISFLVFEKCKTIIIKFSDISGSFYRYSHLWIEVHNRRKDDISNFLQQIKIYLIYFKKR